MLACIIVCKSRSRGNPADKSPPLVPLVQLAEASGSEPECSGFESRVGHEVQTRKASTAGEKPAQPCTPGTFT